MAAIDNVGLRDSTTVLFTSEHGDMVGTYGILEMRYYYEESARSPLMLRAPWLSSAQMIVRGNIGQIDLVSTSVQN